MASTLNFPPNPSVNDTYTIGTNTWIWTGTAWIKYTSSPNSPIAISTSIASTSTNTGALVVHGGIGVGGSVNVGTTSTVNGAVILTTATVSLQVATDGGSSTTNAIHITNTTNSTSTTTGALIVDGGVGIAGALYAEKVKIADAVLDSTLVLVNTTDTVVVDAYPISQFRSAKYLIQIDEGMGPTANVEVIEILLTIDNAGTVYATEYAVLSSNGEMGDFSAALDIGDNNVKLYFTAFQATNKELVVLRTALAV